MSSVNYCAIPAAPAPKGQSSNLIDPNDLSYETLTTGAVLTGISLAFLAGRLLINKKRMALADCKYYSRDPTNAKIQPRGKMCRIIYVALIHFADLSIVGFAFSTGYTGVIMDSKSSNKFFRKCSGFIDDMIVHSYSRHIWDVPACWYMEERLWKV